LVGTSKVVDVVRKIFSDIDFAVRVRDLVNQFHDTRNTKPLKRLEPRLIYGYTLHKLFPYTKTELFQFLRQLTAINEVDGRCIISSGLSLRNN
jgi:hypothetical protein